MAFPVNMQTKQSKAKQQQQQLYPRSITVHAYFQAMQLFHGPFYEINSPHLIQDCFVQRVPNEKYSCFLPRVERAMHQGREWELPNIGPALYSALCRSCFHLTVSKQTRCDCNGARSTVARASAFLTDLSSCHPFLFLSSDTNSI